VTPSAAQLVLARLRAENAIPATAAAGIDLDAAAAAAGRRVVRLGGELRWGWADGREPDPNGPECAGISAFATMLLAALLGLCWRDLAEDPYPGDRLGGDAVGRLAGILDRDRKIVQKFLTELRTAGLVVADADGGIHLGPQVATWPPRLVTALRRHHHVLTAAARVRNQQ
jgi:hypothetical protein